MPENPGSANIVLRNILVGLITTVLGAIILYFLGFRDRNAGSKATQEENLLAKREATIQAWKSYVTAENLLLQNFNTFSANFSLARFDEYKKLALAEVDRFNADLKKILGYKNLDPSMVSLLERRLRDKESWLVKYKAYLGNYQRIATAMLSDDEKNKSLENESYRFQNDVKDLDQKFANEIAGLCKVLTEKNNYNFAWTDLLLFQPPPANTAAVTNTTTASAAGGVASYSKGMFCGHFTSFDAANNQLVGYINIYDNGRFYYYFAAGDSTYGFWQLGNNQMKLVYDQYWGAGQSYVYDITAATDRSFALRLSAPPYNSFSFSRQ